jgi:hypothetical protein
MPTVPPKISKVKEQNSFSSWATGFYSESFRLESLLALLGVVTATKFHICRYFLQYSQLQSLQHTTPVPALPSPKCPDRPVPRSYITDTRSSFAAGGTAGA